MDFSAIFQLKDKKFWWMDVIFYFVISLLIATVFCYIIFFTKNGVQREDIKKEIANLQTVGTEQQKEEEGKVISYQTKIDDFSNLLESHQFASNVFAFLQTQTMPNVWFKQISLDSKNNGVQLSGESDSMDAFSRQVAVFEKNNYIKNITTLNSSLGGSARSEFNINLSLDQSIFSYLSSTTLAPRAAAFLGQQLIQQEQVISEEQAVPEGTIVSQTTPTSNENTTEISSGMQQNILPSNSVASSEKSSQFGPEIIIIIVVITVIVIVLALVFLFIWKKNKTKNL